MKMIIKLLAGATMAVTAISASGSAQAKGTDKAIVLVHGGFVDGSGWEGVYKMIPVDVQRMMAKRAGAKTIDEAGSHAIYVSKPAAVAKLIEAAASEVDVQ
jgi:hypothetical protein